MIKKITLLLSYTIILILTACGSGELVDNSPSTDQLINVSSRDIQDYDNQTVVVNFSGILDTNFFPSTDRLFFYSNASCTNELGSVLVSDFSGQGIDINIPVVDRTVSLHFSSISTSDCNFLEDYSYGTLSPSDPVFSRVVPATPNRISTTPGLFGEVFPSSANVDIFSEAACVTRIGNGTADQFENSGISVVVSANTVTPLYARVTDTLANQSNCVEMITYEHSTSLSDPPVLTEINPASPSNQSFTPFVRGTTATDATTVFLYSDSGCSNELATGTPVEFLNPGLQIDANENGLIEIYAQTQNASAQPSACSRLGEFIHDSIAPANPTFISITPLSPNNQSTSPLITGTSSADTENIQFFSESTCINRIGIGPKANFEGSGVAASVPTNSSTVIYGMAFDAAENGSGCVEFTTYVHNTMPPAPPVFQAFNPPSPTNITVTPNIGGQTSARTLVVNIYNDGLCTNLIGTGSNIEFNNTAIQITVQGNASTDVYLTAVDFEGNESACFSAATYEHSTAAAPNPVFTRTIPESPSNSSINPIVVGSAASSVETITLFSDVTCASQLGTGTRVAFATTGINVTVNANTVNPIYAVARDEFGNDSSCVLLTNYTHVDVPPLNPTFTSVNPTTPNNQSTTPTVFGQALQNMASLLAPDEVIFYNSPTCVTRIGQGPPSAFPAGIQVALPENAESVIYGRSFDAAGNRSDCTLLTPYVHNILEPAVPQFSNSIAASPSYENDIRVFGTYAFSPDFMDRVSLSFFDDSSCTNLITSGNPNLLTSLGFELTVPLNEITSLYARSTNEVGTNSACGFMTNFRHYNEAPTGLNLQSASDGSVRINWLPDNVSQPQPSYTLERSNQSSGPYSVIASSLLSVSYQDTNVSEGETYFYRVYATNNTGRSQYSAPESITISAPNTIVVNNLQANAQNSNVSLVWSGFPQNTKYRVYKSNQSGGPFDELIFQTEQNSYDDSDVFNDSTYYYVIKAVNPSGQSMKSNVASATPKASPPAIENFNLIPFRDSRLCGGNAGFRATWNAQSYFTSYTLNRSRQKDQVGTNLNTTGQNFVTRCNYDSFDSSLYYVNATTLWSNGNQLVSNSIGFSRRSSPNLTANSGEDEVILQWTPSTTPNELSGQTITYDLFVSSDPDRSFQSIGSGLTSVTYTDSLSNDNTRFYYVQAYTTDTAGVRVYLGGPSSVVSGRPSALPTNPSNLIVRYEGQTPNRLSWTAPSHYNGFAIYRSQTPVGPFTEISYTTNNSFNISSQPLGLNYYLVRTVWGSQESSDSNVVSLRVAPISNLTINSNATEIQLNWTAVAGVQDYVVYRDTDLNGLFSTSSVVVTNAFTDTSVISGEGYYYKVKARFLDGSEGVLSDAVSATLDGETLPTSLSLVLSSAGVVDAHWVLVDQAVSYQIYTSQSLSGPFTFSRSSLNSPTSLFGLLPLTEYFVRVDYTFNLQTFSSTVESIFTLPDVQPPSLSPGDGQIDLNWSPVTGVTDYNILRSSDGGQSFTVISSNFGSNTFVDSSVTNGDLYFYKIQANFPASRTRQSLISAGATPGTVPLTPVGLMVENNGSGTAIELSWPEVEGVNRYAIYESSTSGSYGTPKFQTSSNYRVRVNGLSEGQTYYYSVKSVRGTVESAFSNEVSIVAYRPPVKPEAIYATPDSAEINWPVDPQAGVYNVYRSTDGYNYQLISSNISTNQLINTSLDPLLKYFYKYSVVTSSGIETALSEASDPITLSTEPLVPQNLIVSDSNSSEVRLEWSTVPNAGSYEVLRSATSGSGYATIASVASTENFYLDPSVSASQSYYYVVRALSSTQVPSPFSNEVSVSLVSGPTGLVLIDNEGGVDLSWSSLPGAISYEVHRAEEAAGPFGSLGSVAVTNFSDAGVVPSEEYFYKVYGVLADGRNTLASSTENLTLSGFLDFKVAVELLDRPVSSSQTSDVVFERTQTSYTPDDYDGVSSITFQVLANNADTVDRDILLVDSNDLVIGSVTVPQETFNFILIESSALTMNSSEDIYKLVIEQTSIDNQVNILSSKINIYQVDATKTKIYYPLLSTELAPSREDLLGQVLTTSDISYQSFIESIIYKRETLNQSKIFDFNTWELESLVASTNGAGGSLILRNLNTLENVEGSETIIEQNDITLAKSYLNDGVVGLSDSSEGNNFELLLRCNFLCSTGEINVYKSGLWLKLENLNQLRLHERLTQLKSAVSSDTTYSDERLNLNALDYSNSTFYHRAVVRDAPSSTAELELLHHTDASGSLNLVLETATLVPFDFDQKEISTSASFVPTNNDNYVLRIRPTSGSVDLISSFIMIDVNQ